MKEKILVVVDMQNDFISGSLGSERGKLIVPRVCEKINSWDGGYIIATKDTHGKDYLETLEGKGLPVPHCKKDTWGWEFEESIENALKTCPAKVDVAKKITFGSYYTLPDSIIRIKEKEGIGYDSNIEFTLVGLCTDICVISNALLLRARFPESVIHVDASCCGGVTEEKHKAAIEVMKSCQIDVQNEDL